MLKLTLVPLGMLIALAGCGGATGVDDTLGTFSGRLTQSATDTLAAAIECDAISPCPGDLECVSLDADGIDSPVCIEPGTACDLLDCGDGECLQLESYPPQVTCGGSTCDDDGTCDEDGDSTCSSDGVCESPGGDDACDDDGCDGYPGDDDACDENGCDGSPGGDDPGGDNPGDDDPGVEPNPGA